MKQLLLNTGLLLALSCNLANAKSYVHKPANKQANEVVSSQNVEGYSQAELAQMLAPIALYPDSLLTHILISSTYPLEIVEAERWITKNKALSNDDIAKQIELKDWEPSVKALVMFPDVLTRLSDDLQWTSQVGDAFLKNEESVLQSIQSLRYQAEQAGTLKEMENVKVIREDKNIIIQPVQKEVVYVPYYDTRRVFGHWRWALNPPIFWDFGRNIRFANHRHFGWNTGINISLNYFFSAFHWNNRNVVVVNHRNTRNFRPKRLIVNSNYANRWSHKPHHRRGLGYSNNRLNKRFNHNGVVSRKAFSRNPLRNNIDARVATNHRSKLSNKPYATRALSRPTRVNKNANPINNRLSKQEVLRKKLTKQSALSQQARKQRLADRSAFKRSADTKPAANRQLARNSNGLNKQAKSELKPQKRVFNQQNKASNNNQTIANKRQFNQANKAQQRINREAGVQSKAKPQRRTMNKPANRSTSRTDMRRTNIGNKVNNQRVVSRPARRIERR